MEDGIANTDRKVE
jgi:hypothetical protein